MVDHFEFIGKPEIIPKRYRSIIPQWDEVIAGLDIELTTDGISTINQLAIQKQTEEEDCKLLYELLKQVQSIDDNDERKQYIMNHQPLRATLHKVIKANAGE